MSRVRSCYDWIPHFLSGRLADNPICDGNGATEKFCSTQNRGNNHLPSSSCGAISCGRDEVLSPNCRCAHPYTGVLNFFSFSFSDLQNLSYYGVLQGSLMSAFLSRGLPVDSINLTNPTINIFSYLEITLQVFPSGQNSFDRASVSMIGFVLNRQQFPIPIDQYFGPLYFLDQKYCCFPGNMHCFITCFIL